MARNWAGARAKVATEGACRSCHGITGLQAAHIIPRSRVKAGPGEDPLNIVPLCQRCHRLQHDGRLELGPLLTSAEWAYAASLVGMAEAEKRLGSRS